MLMNSDITLAMSAITARMTMTVRSMSALRWSARAVAHSNPGWPAASPGTAAATRRARLELARQNRNV
jgi:hypothetical protein